MERLKQDLLTKYPSGYMLPVLTHWNRNYRRRYKYSISKQSIRNALNGHQNELHNNIRACIRNLLYT